MFVFALSGLVAGRAGALFLRAITHAGARVTRAEEKAGRGGDRKTTTHFFGKKNKHRPFRREATCKMADEVSASDDCATASAASPSSDESDGDLGGSDARAADLLQWIRCVRCTRDERASRRPPASSLGRDGSRREGQKESQNTARNGFLYLPFFAGSPKTRERPSSSPRFRNQVDIARDGAAASQRRRIHGGRGLPARSHAVKPPSHLFLASFDNPP